MIRDPDIEDILQHSATPVDVCDALVDRANQNGGEDNISAIVVQATAYENEE
jgi:protein phosphatase